MSNDIEVLELSSDGTFDIPSEAVKQPPLLKPVTPPKSPPKPNVTTALKETMKAGEYKLYKETTCSCLAIVRLAPDEGVKEVKLENGKLVIDINSADSYAFTLPEKMKFTHEGSSSTVWEDFISIRLYISES